MQNSASIKQARDRFDLLLRGRGGVRVMRCVRTSTTVRECIRKTRLSRRDQLTHSMTCLARVGRERETELGQGVERWQRFLSIIISKTASGVGPVIGNPHGSPAGSPVILFGSYLHRIEKYQKPINIPRVWRYFYPPNTQEKDVERARARPSAWCSIGGCI